MIATGAKMHPAESDVQRGSSPRALHAHLRVIQMLSGRVAIAIIIISNILETAHRTASTEVPKGLATQYARAPPTKCHSYNRTTYWRTTQTLSDCWTGLGDAM